MNQVAPPMRMDDGRNPSRPLEATVIKPKTLKPGVKIPGGAHAWRVYDPTVVRDTVWSVCLLTGGVASAVIPQAADRLIVTLPSALCSAKRRDRLARKMEASLGEGADLDRLRPAAKTHYTTQFEGVWARARGQRRQGWRPEIRIDGWDRLEAAREAGRGTVLWRMSLSSTPVVKIALWNRGVPLVHLSQAEHGAHSNSWVARHVLTALIRRTESPYLAERVIIPWGGSPFAAVRQLLQSLREENAVVSVVGDVSGRGPVETPFLDAHARFPAGAPMLAAKSGAVLLPVYARWEDVGRYRLVIEEPIEMDEAADQSVKVENAIREYARRLETAVRAHPESWRQWGNFWSGQCPYVRK